MQRDRGELAHECAARAGAAEPLAHYEVLEPDARHALPGREARVEQREARGLSVDLGDQRLGHRLRAEQRGLEHLLGADDLIRRALVLGQLDDQREHQRNVLAPGRADARWRAQSLTGGSISRLRILPVGPLGSSSTNHTLPRVLVGGHLLLDELAQLLSRRFLAVLERDRGADLLAELVVLDPDHRRLLTAGCS